MDYGSAGQKNKQGTVSKTIANGGFLMLASILGAIYIPSLRVKFKTEPLFKEDWVQVFKAAGFAYVADHALNRTLDSKTFRALATASIFH
jgi:hypothetical protein